NSKGGKMNRDNEEDKTIYKVVVNHEEQYSVLLAYQENPFGWKDAGKSGSRTECLAYIKEVWTDMRPLSLRKKMGGSLGKARWRFVLSRAGKFFEGVIDEHPGYDRLRMESRRVSS